VRHRGSPGDPGGTLYSDTQGNKLRRPPEPVVGARRNQPRRDGPGPDANGLNVKALVEGRTIDLTGQESRRHVDPGENRASSATKTPARNIAGLYSLVASCEANDVNPIEYLRDVMLRISTHPADRIDELLPDRWNPAESA
jgi:hypothetical protein